MAREIKKADIKLGETYGIYFIIKAMPTPPGKPKKRGWYEVMCIKCNTKHIRSVDSILASAKFCRACEDQSINQPNNYCHDFIVKDPALRRLALNTKW
jgi:hypothetical protein